MQKLKASLGGAVKDAKLWKNVCDEAARVVGGTGAVFLPFNPITDSKRIAVSEDLRPFVDHYASLQVGFDDIRPKTTSLLKALGIICHDDIPVSERPSTTEGALVFERYKFDQFTSMHIRCGNEDWCLALRNPQGPYAERSKHSELINEIRQQIHSAIDQAELVRSSQLEAWRSLFAANAGHVFALAQDGAIFSYNGDRVSSIEETETATSHLTNLIDQIDIRDVSDQLAMLLNSSDFNLPVISRHHEGLARVTDILRLPDEVLDFYARYVALLVVREGFITSKKTEQFLAQNYALLPSEIRVAMGIAAGLSPREIARRHSIAESTARQQLKAVFRKIGVNSQIQLAAFISKFGQ